MHEASYAVRRYAKEQPFLTDELEIIKFICKDFWVTVFKRQIDKLQTNYRVTHLGLILAVKLLAPISFPLGYVCPA